MKTMYSKPVFLLLAVILALGLFAGMGCEDGGGGGGDDDDKKDKTPPGMVRIRAGCFNMGDSFSEGNADELPVHNVCITSSFYMDVHEVTNAKFAACVRDGVCTSPSDSSSSTRSSYYGNATYKNFPVIFVSWNQAADYCAWAGKRLPTEAEWEYAARGGLAGNRYPNGDTISCADAVYERFNSSHACWNYGGLDNDTHQVGSYAPNGYGLYDMAGNVWEWTNDWYSETYYQYCVDNTIVNNPPGPDTGPTRVVRGGGWDFEPNYLRVSDRITYVPSLQHIDLGFRCAGD